MPQQEHFETQGTRDSEFEARMMRALERAPQVAVPENFAARVASSLPPLKKRRRRMSFGRLTLLATAFASTLAMFVIAPHTAPSFTNMAFDLELVLFVELAGIVYGLSKREA